MSIALSLPAVDAHPANPPEIRPAKVVPWLAQMRTREPAQAARLIGDALAATNRIAMGDGKRLELTEKYWDTAAALWPPLEQQFARAAHPLNGDALEAAKVSLTLATELTVAYKHLLASEADKRISFGGQRLMVTLVHRCLQGTARVLVNSFLSYAPVPARTWHDAHLIYAFARARNIHMVPTSADLPESTPDRMTIQMLLLALANPYGFLPGQLPLVLRYVHEYAHWAKLTDVPPVHRMAKAVAIVPVGHDFPPFSANKGGSIEGSKLFLLTFDLAFQIQEQLRALDAGGDVPPGIGKDPSARLQYVTLLKRLLRQWAIPPARQFNRLPSRARVVMCAGLPGVWQYSRGAHAGLDRPPTGLPPMANCQVINHTPAGYALRQTDAVPSSLRIGELIALRIEGRATLQVAMLRWFRNPLKANGLEFGCELLSDDPEAAAAGNEVGEAATFRPAVVLPEEVGVGHEPTPPQIILPTGAFGLEQAITLRRGKEAGFAVLTKLVEQGPGFELYEYVTVG